MEQPNLFEQRAYARSTDPETSWEAAASIKDLRASQAAVLRWFQYFGPATDWALTRDYRMDPMQSPSGLRTRRSELVDLRLLEDSGRREKLPTGRRAIVWQVVE